MAKTKISAKEVMEDIKSGMSDEDLMKKCALSSNGLQSLFKKLIDAKVLTSAMLAERSSEFNLQIDVPVSPPQRFSSPAIATGPSDQQASGVKYIDPYYLNIFTMIEKGKLTKWNWYCFLLSYIWYLYKGMWQKAIIYFVAGLLASGITFWARGVGGIVVWIIMCMMANWDYYLYEVHGETMFTKHWVSWWHGKFPDDLPKKITEE